MTWIGMKLWWHGLIANAKVNRGVYRQVGCPNTNLQYLTFSLAVFFAANRLHFIPFPLYLFLILMFHIRAQMFHFLRIILMWCSIFTLNTIMRMLSFIILVNSQLLAYGIAIFTNIDFCAMVEVSSSNAYQCICKIHTIYYAMF